MKNIFFVVSILFVLLCFTEKTIAQCPSPVTTNGLTCGPGNVTLSAATNQPGGYLHRWYTTQTGGIPSTPVYVNAPFGTVSNYTVYCSGTVTLWVSSYQIATGCESPRVAVTGTVRGYPYVGISTSAPASNVCPLNTGFTLTANGESGYQWMLNNSAISGATGASYQPTQAGSYTVQAHPSCGGIVNSAPVDVSFATVITPSVSITGPSSICEGSSANFTASVPAALQGLVNYQWYAGSRPIGTNSASLSTTDIKNGENIRCDISINTANACASPSSASSNLIPVTIVISAAPSSTTPTIICGTGTATLMAVTSQGANYKHYWYISADDKNPLVPVYSSNGTSTVSSYSFYCTQTTTMWVSSYIAPGCESARVPVTATVRNMPSVSISPAGPLSACSLAPNLTLTATGESGYQWKKDGVDIPNETSSNFYPKQTGSYTVLAHPNCGGTALSNPVSVTIADPIPLSVSISGPSSICAGSTANFTASIPATLQGKVNYQWYAGSRAIGTNSASLSTTDINNGENLKCIVSLNAANICASPSSATSNSIQVTIVPLVYPSIVLTGPISLCNGIGGNYSVSVNNTYDNSSFKWYLNGVLTSNTGTSYKPSTALNTGDKISCSYKSTAACAVEVGSNLISVVKITPSAPIASISVDNYTVSGYPPTISACAGAPLVFRANISNAGTAPTYVWTLNSTPISGATQPSYTSTSITNGQRISLTVTSSDACVAAASATATLIVSINPIPALATVTTNYACTSATLVPSVVSGATSYWQTTSSGTTTTTSNNYLAKANGSYYLRTRGSAGCWNAGATTVIVSNLSVNPTVPIFTVASCMGKGNVISTLSNPVAGQSYLWFKNGVQTSTTTTSFTDPLAENTQGVYLIKTTSANQCSASSISQTGYAYALPVISSSADVLSTGDAVTLTLNRSYPIIQWKKDGVVLAGVTGTSYTTKKTGSYTVAVQLTAGGTVTATSPKVLKGAMAGQDLNYITTRTILKEGVKTEDAINGLPIDSIQETTTYFDGLGRPMQSVVTKGSPDKLDIVQHVAYDDFGRESRKFLPYIGGNDGLYKTTAAADQLNFYSDKGTSPIKDANPWADTRFEASPLNRPLEQGAPGADWQLGKNTTTIAYETNTANEVMLFTVDANNACVWNSKYYDAAQLHVNIVSDENKHISKEYKDKQGKVVLKSSSDGSKWLRTYYVYDVYEKLRYVLQPRAVEYIEDQKTASFAANDVTLKDLIFYYRYDSRLRQIEKRLPGAEPVLMVYDKRDRLVLSQDGNQRTANKWLFTKYDAFNRPVVTGTTIVAASENQTHLQSTFDNATVVANESLSTNATCTIGYSNTVYPTNVEQYLTATYYDNYSYTGVVPYDASNNISGKTPLSKIIGKITGSRVLVMDGSTTPRYTLTTTYYDDRYRPIEIMRKDILPTDCAVAQETISSLYDFSGKVMQTMQSQNIENKITRIDKYMTYDHVGRLLKTEMTINGASTKTALSTLVYNKLGQLQNKKLGGNIDETNYNYTVRGWLKSMNGLTLTGNQHFGQTLYYGDDMVDLKNTAQWNGNISGAKWATSSLSETLGYAYLYDGINRLTSANFWRSNNSQWNKGSYNDSVTYDSNGNIRTYFSRGASGALVDSMTYTYYNNNYSNRLKRIDDPKSGGFPNTTNNKADIMYTYDANGNENSDKSNNKEEINSVLYNHLNLPKSMSFSGTHNLTFTYDAVGAKLCKRKTTSNTTNDTVQYYAGNMVYDGSKKLLFILTEEGRAVNNSGSFSYEYFVKDHLGNTRMVLKDNNGSALPIQETHYYPFGLPMLGLGTTVDASSPKNNYLYNGKELQTDFGQDWGEDYGARYMGLFKRRWGVIDPLCEKSRRWSPYNYCLDNPLKFIDPDGMDTINAVQQEAQKMITNTLTTDDAKYVSFDENGNIDKDLVNSHCSDSGNYNDLQNILNSSTPVIVMLDDKVSFVDGNGQPGVHKMSYSPPDPTDTDPTGKTISGTSTGESGFMGKTLFPDLKGGENSPDRHMYIIVNKNLSEAAAAETHSHEANGHGVIYVTTHDREQASHQVITTGGKLKETNKILIQKITTSKKETILNMKSR